MELSTSKPRIVILDGFTLNPGDLQWDALDALGWVARFDYTPEQEVVTRASHADILIVNKTAVNAAIMAQLPDLRCICVTATGYNNIDIETARQRGITVCNVTRSARASWSSRRRCRWPTRRVRNRRGTRCRLRRRCRARARGTSTETARRSRSGTRRGPARA